jgi:hypothetical protein
MGYFVAINKEYHELEVVHYSPNIKNLQARYAMRVGMRGLFATNVMLF